MKRRARWSEEKKRKEKTHHFDPGHVGQKRKEKKRREEEKTHHFDPRHVQRLTTLTHGTFKDSPL